MATAKTLGVADIPFIADTDLTQQQYRWVTAASTAGYVKLATGASNPAPIGILQNSPSAGQEARVRVVGFSKTYAVNGSGSALGYGRFVTVNSSGESTATATESGSPIVARWLDTVAPVSSSRVGQVYVFGFVTCALSAS